MADHELNCTWEQVEHAALTPNVFVNLSYYNDPDLGEIIVSDQSGADIYYLLSENPETNIICYDPQGRKCDMTTRPVNGDYDVVFSVLDGTTLYKYSIPDGYQRVYVTTIDITSFDDIMCVHITYDVGTQLYAASESYSDIHTAIVADKIVFARTPDGTAWCSGEINEDAITFVVNALSASTPQYIIYEVADDEGVSRSTSSGGGGTGDSIIYVPVVKSGSTYTVDFSDVDLHGYSSLVAAWNAGADIRMYMWVSYDLYTHPLIGWVSNYSDVVFGGPEFDAFNGTVETAVYHITSGGDVYRYTQTIPSAQGVSF